MKPAWWYLSMNNNVPIRHNGFLYKNMYRMIYGVAFPSRREEINAMSLNKLRDLNLGLEYFEISENEVIKTLVNTIVNRCRLDQRFLSLLTKTRDRRIINNDYFDKYFGGNRNIYGRCLMTVRNKKMYLRDGVGLTEEDIHGKEYVDDDVDVGVDNDANNNANVNA